VNQATAVPTDGFAYVGPNRIHFVEQGEGRPVLLIHGAYGSGSEFLARNIGKTLAQRYRVLAPDSLAHGDSDAPEDAAFYSARARASHLAAVLDAVEIEQAHVIGYSMGGWMASAFATFHPDRVASLAIGGWDVVRGMYTPAAAWGLPMVTSQILNDMVRRDRPDLIAWLRPENEPGLCAAIDGMNDLEGLADGVARCPAPTVLWIGREDLYYDAVAGFAAVNALPVIDLPGDHMVMLEEHGAEAGRRIIDFIETNAGA